MTTTEGTKGFTLSGRSEDAEIKEPVKKKKYLILSSLPDDLFEAESALTKAMLRADEENAIFIRNRNAIEDPKNSEVIILDLDLLYRYQNL